MTNTELWDYIEEAGKRGSIYGLDTLRKLLERIGNPENDLKFIHIAGTNGKGSTLSFVANILRASNYNIGTFSSPAVFDYREKIRYNLKDISLKELRELFEYIIPVVQDMETQGLNIPTLFEIEVAVALLYFKNKNCDFVILECGLGGLMDGTNVIPAPLITIFTSISYDHMAILGNSIEEIANNKAGIIKSGTIVVSNRQIEAVSDIITDKCRRENVNVTFISTPEKIKSKIDKLTFDYKDYKKLESSIIGLTQPFNIATAIEAIEALNTLGYDISEKAIRKGILKAKWPGRFEVIHNKPLFIIDGAHNEAAALYLSETVDYYLKDMPLIAICGMFRDKDCDKVVKAIASKATFFIAIKAPTDRGLDNIELANIALQYNSNVITADSPEEAAEMAFLLAGQKQNKCGILAYGSLSYLGRIKSFVNSEAFTCPRL